MWQYYPGTIVLCFLALPPRYLFLSLPFLLVLSLFQIRTSFSMFIFRTVSLFSKNRLHSPLFGHFTWFKTSLPFVLRTPSPLVYTPRSIFENPLQPYLPESQLSLSVCLVSSFLISNPCPLHLFHFQFFPAFNFFLLHRLI